MITEERVKRCIRAYHKQTETLTFAVQLPPDSYTFLSMVDFLQDDIDPLLYGCYELTKEQVDYLFGYWHLLYQADTDYFDYFLECDSVSKIKTKEDFFDYTKKDCTDFIVSIIGNSDSSFGVPAAYKQDFCELQELLYRLYQEGISDGKL